jgi:hypothetical protein
VGCGSSSAPGAGLSRAELALQRSDLVVLTRGLRQARGPIEAELQTARSAWPLIAGGLPTRISPALSTRIAAARGGAERVAVPDSMVKAEQLTGPAGGIAALLRSFAGLSERGWRLTEAAAAGAGSGPPASARFMRANAGLYINSIYDGHYNLAAIGETLRKAYLKLGGARAFGQRLTQADVDELARVYSPARARLHPRPAVWTAH